MGPSTRRNPGAKSSVASMTKAMILPENITVPTATACKARRELVEAFRRCAHTKAAPMTNKYRLAVAHESKRSEIRTPSRAWAPNAPEVAPNARKRAPIT